MLKFGSFPENVHENCDLPTPTYRNKSVLQENYKLISEPIFESTLLPNSKLCMFQKYTSSPKLFFGECTNAKSKSFSYYNSDPQMLSFRWKSRKWCLSASLDEKEGFVSFQTCDIDDFSQKWLFGGDDDTFIRWQMDESLCIGANGVKEFANAVLVQCDSFIKSGVIVKSGLSGYVPFTPVSFDF